LKKLEKETSVFSGDNSKAEYCLPLAMRKTAFFAKNPLKRINKGRYYFF